MITRKRSQRSSHCAQLLKRDIRRTARLLYTDELATEGEKVVKLFLGRLGRETGNVDGIPGGRGGSTGHNEGCER